jgi:ketosteroid isomerase-like protein
MRSADPWQRQARFGHRTRVSTQEIVTAYLRAVESHDLDAVALFHHDDIEVVEHPNKLNPTGKRYDKAALRAAGERGKVLLASEHYAIRSMIVEGERAAVMTVWTGIVNDGRQLSAQICSIIELRDGKVWRQEQFDCFA